MDHRADLVEDVVHDVVLLNSDVELVRLVRVRLGSGSGLGFGYGIGLG